MEGVRSGPEQLMRVEGFSAVDGLARGRMALGPWATGTDGATLLAALCVLADDVLGQSIVTAPSRAADRWSVSTLITIDAVAPLPAAPGTVDAASRLLGADDTGAFAGGELLAGGTVVATIGQRAHWVPIDGMRDPFAEQAAFALPEGADLASTFGFGPAEPGGALPFVVDERVRNPGGNLHGGVSMAAAALAAAAALDDGGSPLRITGLRTAFLRPTLPGMRVAVEPRVLHRGRSTATVDVAATADGAVRTLTRVTAGR
jgi:acyl-coenzyme A thioesterase PaaI-like protein